MRYFHSNSMPRIALATFFVFAVSAPALAQGSATLGSGLSAAAVARGGESTVERNSPLDAVEGNPSGLAGLTRPTVDLGAVALYDGGSFSNAANTHAHIRGLAGAIPYGVFATPVRRGRWVAAFGVTPEILMKANWHYLDAPGTAGVTYGYQQQETQIIAVRSSLSLARTMSPKFSAGVSLGVVYNQNDLHAPYIFQQQPQLEGLKVLLGLTTRGYGWNGSAGIQWQPARRVRAGLAWKSGTTLRTQGDADGSASALFNALGITSDPAYHYHAQVENHLPQAFNAGAAWETGRRITVNFETGFTAWGQAFQSLPIMLTGGTNPTINSVVGSSTLIDNVPLHWNNQVSLHMGVEAPVSEFWTVRGGFSHANDPVPSATLTPLTAAIMQDALATGAGYTHGRWHLDAAYQAQLPTSQSVRVSALKAGEYSNSKISLWTQSVTLTVRGTF